MGKGGRVRRYSQEEVDKVRAEVEARGEHSVREIAKENNMPVSTIYTWRQKDWTLKKIGKNSKARVKEDRTEDNSINLQTKSASLSAELKALVRQEVKDVLKSEPRSKITVYDFITLMVDVGEELVRLNKEKDVIQTELTASKSLMESWRNRASDFLNQLNQSRD